MSGHMGTTQHLGHLDGIRGLTALYVVVLHCFIWSGWWPFPLPNPKIAVDVFMIMSGYLMAWHYAGRDNREPVGLWQTAVRFWIRRFFRIAPIYYLTLLAVFFLVGDSFLAGNCYLFDRNIEFWRNAAEYNPRNIVFTSDNLIAHITFAFGLIPKCASSTGLPDWSIGLEMQFYAVFPLLFIIGRRISFVALALLGWTMVIVTRLCITRYCMHAGIPWLFSEPSFLLLKLNLFLSGMLAAETSRYVGRKRQERIVLGMLAILLVPVGETVVIMALCLCMLRPVFRQDDSQKWLSKLLLFIGSRFMRFLANCSYSVYLVHVIFIGLFGAKILGHYDRVQAPVWQGGLLMLMMVLVATYATAWIAYLVVERPCINAGRWLVNRWFPLKNDRSLPA